MKLRITFVTNSSSSSYVCQVTSSVECGFDLSMRDASMVECENGHMFYERFVLNFSDVTYEEVKAALLRKTHWFDEDGKHADDLPKDLAGIKDEYYELDGHEFVPARACPLCTLAIIREKDALDYLLRSLDIDRFTLDANIRERFDSLAEMLEFIKPTVVP